MKTIRTIFCLLLVSVMCFGKAVCAADYTTIDSARTIKTDGTAVTYHITQDDSTYYGKFSVKTASQVRLTVKKPYNGKLSYKIVASDKQTVVLEKDVNNASASSSEYLPKGSFYVVITRHDGSGNASVSITSDALSKADTEPNDTLSNAENIGPDTEKHGVITWNDKYDIYRLKLDYAGILNLDLKKYFTGSVIYGIKSADGTSLVGATMEAGKDQGRITACLAKGTYYITIQPGANTTGKYTIKTALKKVSSDPEKNDTLQTASAWKMSSKGITQNGFISYEDPADYYKVTLNKAGKITCKISKGFLGDLSYSVLLPDDMTVIRSGNIEGKGTAEKKISESFTTYLEAGTYYLRIRPREGSQTSYGVYTVKTTLSNVTNDSSENNQPKNATRLAVNGSYASGCLTWQDGADHYAFRLEKDDKIELNIKKNFNSVMQYEILNDATLSVLKAGSLDGKAGVYRITEELPAGSYVIRIKKYANSEGTYSLKVADKAPETPTVKKVTIKSTKVTGTAMPNTSVTVKVGSKNYTTTSSASGTYTVKIAKQKKGTVVKVYAKNSLGTSSTKTIKVTAK